MRFIHIVLPLTLLATACLGQDVRYNFDKSTSFSKYRTYKWVQIKDAPQLPQLADQQVKAAIEAELSKKGLTKTADEQAELWIALQFTLNQEKEFSSYSSDFGYGAGWGRGWYGGGMGSTMTTGQTTTIHIGSLGLDMYDPATKQIVWRGVATKTLDPKAKPEKRQKNIDKGVVKLLKNYPPPPPKS